MLRLTPVCPDGEVAPSWQCRCQITSAWRQHQPDEVAHTCSVPYIQVRAHKGRQPHNKGCSAAPAAAAALCTSHALAFAALEICFVVAIATPYGTPHILAHRQRETSGTSGRGVLLTSWVESFPP